MRQEPEGSSSSSSSQPSKKVKVNEDDEESDDEDDVGENAVFVAEDLSGVIEASNIIPRTKRRSALASGLVRANNGHTGSSSSAKRTIDSDDEEGDF